MNQNIADILARLHSLHDELEVALAQGRSEFAFTVRPGVVRFEETILRQHRRLKMRLWQYVSEARPSMLLVAPIIYALILPFGLLDLFITIYQRACFPLFRIPPVTRRDYFVMDRRYLAYLNIVERFNCVYCSYANGVVAYAREVASLTEQYWCPIKHSRRILGAHIRYAGFADFGDAAAYQKELQRLKEELLER